MSPPYLALFGFALLSAVSVHAADLPIPYNPNSVEYKNYSKSFAWKPLPSTTPGSGGISIYRPNSEASTVSSKPDSLKLTQAGKTVNVNAGVNMPLGATGKTVPIFAKAAVTGAMYARGVQAILGGPLGISLLALPLLMSWVDSLGDHRVDRQTGEVEKLIEGTEFDTFCELSPSQQTAYSDFISSKTYTNASWQFVATPYQYVTATDTCWFGVKIVSTRLYDGAVSNSETSYIVKNKNSEPRNTAKWIPYTMGQTASAFDRPNAPALTPEILNEGVSKGNVDPFISTPPEYTTSGPGSVAGPSTTTTAQTRVETGTTREASPGSTVATDPATKTTTTTTNNTVNYNGDKVTYNTTTSTVTNITNTATGVTEKVAEEVTVKEGESPPEKEQKDDEPAVDTPLGDIPKLYERKYPDGMVGIWNDKKQAFKDSSVGVLVGEVLPKNIGDGGCPQWQIPLDVGIANYGVFDASIPCQYWGYLRIIMIVGSLFLARALIFGG